MNTPATPVMAESLIRPEIAALRYPDAANVRLRERIGAGVGIAAERVIVGSGSEDLIGALFRATLRPGNRVVTLCPSFGLHEFGALACGARVTKVAFPADWRFPTAALADAPREPARILIFSSPSNPACPVVTEDAFREVLAATPAGTLVAFDAAYLEYVAAGAAFDPLAVLAGAMQPWVVLRTFS